MPVGVAAGELPSAFNRASNDERLLGRFVGEFRFADGLRVWLESRCDQLSGDFLGAVPEIGQRVAGAVRIGPVYSLTVAGLERHQEMTAAR